MPIGDATSKPSFPAPVSGGPAPTAVSPAPPAPIAVPPPPIPGFGAGAAKPIVDLGNAPPAQVTPGVGAGFALGSVDAVPQIKGVPFAMPKGIGLNFVEVGANTRTPALRGGIEARSGKPYEITPIMASQVSEGETAHFHAYLFGVDPLAKRGLDTAIVIKVSKNLDFADFDHPATYNRSIKAGAGAFEAFKKTGAQDQLDLAIDCIAFAELVMALHRTGDEVWKKNGKAHLEGVPDAAGRLLTDPTNGDVQRGLWPEFSDAAGKKDGDHWFLCNIGWEFTPPEAAQKDVRVFAKLLGAVVPQTSDDVARRLASEPPEGDSTVAGFNVAHIGIPAQKFNG